MAHPANGPSLNELWLRILEVPGLALALSMVALGLGPLLMGRGEASTPGRRAAAAFPLGAVAALVLVHLLPHAIEEVGWGAMVAGLLGIAAPIWLERRAVHPGLEGASLKVALVAAALHESVDGAALASAVAQVRAGQPDPLQAGDHLAAGLSLAILFHRFPVGAATWRLASGVGGPRVAAGALGVLGLATVVGYLAGHLVLPLNEARAVVYFQAFAAGSFLHVLGHQPLVRSPGGPSPVATRIGLLMGFATFSLLASHG